MNYFTYQHSWDIQKFSTLATIALSVAASAVVAKVFTRGPSVLGRGAGAVLVVGATVAGLAFPAAFALRLHEISRFVYPERPARLPRPDAQAVSWLRTRVAPGEVVYRSEASSPSYAQFGGLAQAWLDVMVPSFGFSRQRQEVRSRLLEELPAEPTAYLRQRIWWFVLSVNEGDRLNEYADLWVRSGQARELARFGPLRVIMLHHDVIMLHHDPPGTARRGRHG